MYIILKTDAYETFLGDYEPHPGKSWKKIAKKRFYNYPLFVQDKYHTSVRNPNPPPLSNKAQASRILSYGLWQISRFRGSIWQVNSRLQYLGVKLNEIHVLDQAFIELQAALANYEDRIRDALVSNTNEVLLKDYPKTK